MAKKGEDEDEDEDGSWRDLMMRFPILRDEICSIVSLLISFH